MKNNRFEIKSISSAKRFTLVMSSLLIITLGLIIFLQIRTYHIIENEAKERNQLLIEQTCQIVDRYLEDISLLSLRLSGDTSISRFLRMERLDEGSPKMQELIDSSETISNYAFQNSFVSDVLIYSHKNGYVLSIDRTFIAPDMNYGVSWKMPGLSYAQWKDLYFDRYHNKAFLPSRTMLINNQEEQIIPFLQSLPIEYSRHNLGKLCILLKESIILDIMKNLELGDSGFSSIIGSDGTVLVSYSPGSLEQNPGMKELSEKSISLDAGTEEITLDGTEYIVTTTISDMTGWTFLSLLPVRELQSKTSYIFKAYAFVTLAFLIILGTTTILFSLRETISWSEIYKLLSPSDDIMSEESDFQSIQASITHLVESNRLMQEIRQKQRPEMLKMVLQLILSGRLRDTRELIAMEQYLGINLDAERYIVFILKVPLHGDILDMETLKTLEFYRLLLQELLKGILKDNYLFTEEEPGQIACLTWWNRNDDGDLSSRGIDSVMNQINRDLSQVTHREYHLGVGNAVGSLPEANFSYLQAREVLRYMDLKEKSGILRTDNLPDRNRGYYYPMELETRLLNTIESGDEETACIILDNLFKENITDRDLAPEMLEQFFMALKGTFIRLIRDDKAVLGNLLKELQSLDDATADEINGLFKKIIGITAADRNLFLNEKNSQLANALRFFLNDNYQNPNLTLEMTAEHFKKKESTLYFFFKKNIEMSFSDYLCNLRLSRAEIFLKSGNWEVNEIASEVGFSSSQTFRRSFKKKYGITPTHYRDVKKDSIP